MTQLDKLVRVLKVVELHKGTAVERELALIKVPAEPGTAAASCWRWPGCSARRWST